MKNNKMYYFDIKKVNSIYVFLIQPIQSKFKLIINFFLKKNKTPLTFPALLIFCYTLDNVMPHFLLYLNTYHTAEQIYKYIYEIPKTPKAWNHQRIGEGFRHVLVE